MKIAAKLGSYSWMSQHAGKHRCEPVARHDLVAMADISVVAIEANWNSPAHLRFQLARMNAPLFERVIQVKRVVELLTYLAQYEFLGITRRHADQALRVQQTLG